MFAAALKLAILKFCLATIETCLSWQVFSRPICIASFAGLVLGDVKTGCMMGALLESVFMGINWIGGTAAADQDSASYIVTSMVILSGTDPETAMAFAVPVGTIMLTLGRLPMTLLTPLQPAIIELANQGDIKKFSLAGWGMALLNNLFSAVLIFVLIYIGSDALANFLASLPPVILTGFGAASSMSMGVGFAILTSMIWDNEIGIWFFVGYVLVKFGVLTDTLAIAIIAVAIALTKFFIEKKVSERQPVAAADPTETEEEEFW